MQSNTRTNTLFALGAIVASTLAATACSDDGTDTVVAGPPAVVTAVSGDGGNNSVGSTVGPFAVKVTDSAGTVVQGVVVTFVASDGLTLANTTATTDVAGVAFTSGTLSHSVGVRTITATVTGVPTGAIFHTTANALEASLFAVASGNNQTSVIGTALTESLAVAVTDQYGNGISGATVNWTTTSGTLGTASNHTGASGQASTTFTPTAAGGATITASTVINGVVMNVTFTETGTH